MKINFSAAATAAMAFGSLGTLVSCSALEKAFNSPEKPHHSHKINDGEMSGVLATFATAEPAPN